VLFMLATVAVAQEADDNATDDTPSRYPTTEFADGADSASVSVGDLTAAVTMAPNPDPNGGSQLPTLSVVLAGKTVVQSTGTDSATDEPDAEASIAEMDPGNHHPEVYFSSYSGCCTTVIVAEELGDRWVAVPVGDFNGDGGYLDDLDGDGLAEIATIDVNFINRFDCTACSAAPRVIYTVRDGKVVDLTTEPKFLPAHRAWLKELEDSTEPAERWKSPGFLAGWLGEKIRLGEGAAAWSEINAHWDFANDPGDEVCPNGDDPDTCAKADRKTLKFPERLRLFLTAQGYKF
jgi:hypothetical protein